MQRSLILMRVPFEMLDCYLSLFYLAFWDGDMLRLRAELMVRNLPKLIQNPLDIWTINCKFNPNSLINKFEQGLFMADTFRRVLVEAAIPYLQSKISGGKVKIKKEITHSFFSFFLVFC